MGRPPCCDKSMVKKGLWTADEDAKLLAYISTHGTGNWTSVPKKAGLKRCGKSCRLRWTNYLRPNLKHEGFTPEEEERIVALHATIGSRWSIIAKQLPGRTDNDIKNYWNTKLSKQLYQNGIDPITHRPVSLVMQSIKDLQTHASAAAGGSRCYTPRNLNTVLFLPSLPPPINLLSSQRQLSRPPFAAVLNDGGPPNPVYFAPSEPSCCSTAATAPPPPPSPDFNWTDLLAESVLSDDNSGVGTCASAVNAESAKGGRVGSAGEACGASLMEDEGTSHGGGASCSGSSSFVDAMLEQDRKLFSKFCEFLGDI